MSNNTVFFEVQDWETPLLEKEFHDANLISDKLSPDNVETYKDAQIVSCFVYSDLSAEILSKLPNLKFIATRSTGFDHIDLEYCKAHNIAVSNVPEYGSNTVAEHTFALILSLTRKIYQSVSQAKQLNFDHSQIRGSDVYKKTLGIVGLGKIGLNVLRIAKGFGMRVLVSTRTHDEKIATDLGFEFADMDTLIKTADIISLHLPLNPETKHIIGKEEILKMKKGVFLINTARGGLVDTEGVIEGLGRGILGGVALDVLEEEKELSEEAAILTPRFRKEADMETLVMNHYLINHPKVLITPHNAFNSIEALHRIEDTTIENIRAYEKSSPINIVSK